MESIKVLVIKIKEKMFSDDVDLYSFVSKSAYDTAWLAMIPDSQQRHRPMFKGCLNWVLDNQKDQGFWGETDDNNLPTIDTLPATLACMVALSTWNVGARNIEKGLEFVRANAKKLLEVDHGQYPRWFTVVFPAMVELAQATGLDLGFPSELQEIVSSIYFIREELDETCVYPPLLSYLEVLPLTYEIGEQDVVKHLDKDGSLSQSPSATSFAYMATGNPKCLKYLESLVQKCPNGVPSVYPMDEGFIRLCMVDQIQKLGLAEHFAEEIEETLAQIYRSYMNSLAKQVAVNFTPAKIYKDSLAFRLLRLHGYNITPSIFCSFLNEKHITDHLEENCEKFASAMLNVYRASEIMFPGEHELEETKSFSRRLLEKTMSLMKYGEDDVVISKNFRKTVEQEFSLPWIARLDHLDHRMWIEENYLVNPLWTGKASFYRLSCLNDEILMQLAVENYKFRQSVYRKELEELTRWCKEWGLMEMGFGREKTAYCYFAVSASTSLPLHSLVRKVATKSAILITVSDDFYDMKGSLGELHALTEAVRRWDSKGLSGPGILIFDALNDLVRDMAEQFLHLEGHDLTKKVQAIWSETFASWMTETLWARTGYKPSAGEYLGTAMTSIAAHAIVLPSSCFLSQRLPSYKLCSPEYEITTKLLKVITRLLNDTQSYQKEREEGKWNYVLLYFNDNPEADIEDSIAHIRKILDEKRKEFLEHVLRDDFSNGLPKSFRHLHLSCFKAFQMLYNSTNRFDSNIDLLEDIKKAIYIPPAYQISKTTIKSHFPPKKDSLVKINTRSSKNIEVQAVKSCYRCRNFTGQGISITSSEVGCGFMRHLKGLVIC